MKVLFITRKYPPSKGGMEKISHDVINNFPELENAKVISWSRNQKGLIVFVPWAFLKSLYFLTFKKVDLIHFGDCALSFMGYALKKVFRKPTVITAHGLDLTYQNKFYQVMINKTLKSFDKVICVSEASKQVAESKGISPDRCITIPNGIDTSEWRLNDDRKVLRKRLAEKTGLDLEGKFLLLSAGRLVERKGIYWFVKNVFPKLKKDCIFLVVGAGEEEQRIREAVISLKLEDRVFILGRIPDEMLKLLYNATDVFVMPNIPIKGDMEGFGIVAIEAASCGLPVVASRLEGIRDAINDGKNGFLVEPYNTEGYIKKINEIIKMKNLEGFKKKQMNYTSENYNLKKISNRYYSVFKSI